MKINLFILTIVSTICSSCSVIHLDMNPNKELENNAQMYKITYPNSLSDKASGRKLNISFGPYKVSKMDLSWTASNTKAEDPDPFFVIKNENVSGSGKTRETTTFKFGPKEILGFSRGAGLGEPSLKNTHRTMTYKFDANGSNQWSAKCVHRSLSREIEYSDKNSSELISSLYVCKLQVDNKLWRLTADHKGNIILKEEKGKNAYRGTAVTGIFVNKDGKKMKDTKRIAGYSWHHKGKQIATIATTESNPRVWLHKRNGKSLNNLIAFASTGMLVYNWEVVK